MMKPVKEAVFADRDGRPVIQRYGFGARFNHWVVAVFFLISMLSGLAFFHPIGIWVGEAFGSLTWARIWHPILGLLMFVFFIGLVIRFWGHNTLDQNDIKWLANIKYMLLGQPDRMPPANQFNAGQKMLFWILIVLMLGLLATGIIIWRAYFSHLFSAELVRLSLLLHALLAFALICFMIIHIYAAFMADGSVEAMLYGKVSYGWLKHHHRLFYDQVVAKEEKLANR